MTLKNDARAEMIIIKSSRTYLPAVNTLYDIFRTLNICKQLIKYIPYFPTLIRDLFLGAKLTK